MKKYNRREGLELAIYRLYSQMESEELEDRESEYDETALIMGQVLKIDQECVALNEFCLEVLYFPTVLPAEIHRELRVGDLFMATLGKVNGCWHVLWMSNLYH